MSYLVQLRSFLDVYRSGSISKAAHRLAISQPAVSSHIHALEALTGCMLFIRRPYGVIPTADADELAKKISNNLDVLESNLTLIRNRRKKITGDVSIIAPAEFLWANSSRLFFPIAHSDLRVKLLTGNREQIYASLNDGVSQIAITTSQPDPRKFGYKSIGKEKLVIIASTLMLPLFEGKEVTADFLESLPMISYDDQLPLIREFFKKVFGAELKTQASITIPDLRIIEKMLWGYSGWTIMPEYLCREAILAGKVIHIAVKSRVPENDIYLVWNESALRYPGVIYVRDKILESVGDGLY